MITEVKMENYKNKYRLTVKNHAKTSEFCAGISTLIFTLLGYLINDKSVKIAEEKVNEGDVDIKRTSNSSNVKAVFNCIRIGFKQLEKTDKTQIKVL